MMKFILIRILMLLLLSGLLSLLWWIGSYEYIFLPFRELEDRVKLLSHVNYIALVGLVPMSLGVIMVGSYQLFNTKKALDSYTNIWLGILYFSVFIAVLSLVPRIYLGHKVDEAGYVKCVKESRTSSKSSWRIYAKDISLCKDSKGIAGG